MHLEQGKTVIDSAISQQQLCLVVGHCQVKYKGRAASKLSQGDRLLVIKPDGTFLVHQNSKMAAINYQGPGAIVSTEIRKADEDADVAKVEKTRKTETEGAKNHGPQKDSMLLVVKAERKKPQEEVIEVAFDSLQSAQNFSLQDDESLKLFGSERQLADLLEQDLGLIEKGMRPLQTESHFNKGAIDILAQDKDGRLVAIELKRRTAGLDAVTQLVRYVKQLSHRKDAKATPDANAQNKANRVRGILCAPEITPNALTMLEQEGLEYFKLDYEISNPSAKIKGLQKKQKMLEEFR
ncbi:endonuclease NucS [Candidatus Micrarchaeota archaeon]|nr:endonuclease NucS [Candidatus Micrarchaeota archaeon]